MILAVIQEADEVPSPKQALAFSVLERHWAREASLAQRLSVPTGLAVDSLANAFERYAAVLSRLVTQDEVHAVVVCRHGVNWDKTLKQKDLNPIGHTEPLGTLVAMLILAFPDVSWGFELPDPSDGQLRTPPGCGPPPLQLFDLDGLRDCARRQAVESPDTHHDADYLPRRVRLALSLDEESSYSLLHAYTAYRFGFRSGVADRFSLAKALLKERKYEWSLVFEDVYLSFPDGHPGLSKLYSDPDAQPPEYKGRATEWEKLEDAEHRIFVTSGHHDDEVKWIRNEAYLARQRQRPGVHLERLFKPHAGIFRLWRDSGLAERLLSPANGPSRPTVRKRVRAHVRGDSRSLAFGTAEGFVWPPTRASDKDRLYTVGHSSPGALMLVANHLIQRAKDRRDSVRTVKEAVHGAVLATDALELLGGRTPTLAVEALRLRHLFEVKAECLFSGVEHHLSIRDRLDEIRRDAKYISSWFGVKQAKTAALNAEMQTVLETVTVLRDHNHFDEEEECLQRTRDIQRRLWVCQCQSRPGKALAWIAQPIWIYINWLIGGPLRFVGSLVLLLFAGWLVLRQLPHQPGCSAPLQGAFNALFTFNPPSDNCADARYLVAFDFGVLLGVLHLGVFLSRLYTWISRK